MGYAEQMEGCEGYAGGNEKDQNGGEEEVKNEEIEQLLKRMLKAEESMMNAVSGLAKSIDCYVQASVQNNATMSAAIVSLADTMKAYVAGKQNGHQSAEKK